MEYAEQKLNLLCKILDKGNWELVSNDGNVITNKTFFKDSNIACFHANGFVACSPEELLNLVCNIYDDATSIKKYDNDVFHYEVVEKLSDESRLCYQINSMPWPIWQRDLLYVQNISKRNNCYWIYMYSVESPMKPRNNDKYVRAVLNISAYGFVPENNGCRVHRIVHVDPCGSIPTSVVNSYAGKPAAVIGQLQKLYPPS